MRRFITLIFFLFALSEIFGQRPSIALTFSAVNNTDWVQLDSIRVMNRTQGGDTVLYYPDTVLVLDYEVGIPEVNNADKGFKVFQNYPNPTADQTTINLYVPSKDLVSMTITDVLGRVIIRLERVLDEGLHSFRLTPGDGSIFFFTAQWRGKNSSIKILCTGILTYKAGSLEYRGTQNSSTKLTASEDLQSFDFSIGDELLYIGYTYTTQSGIWDAPEDSQSYTFQFATNIPCPGTPTVEYGGQFYNTIQIFSQCWMKEDLNVGTMIPGQQEMADDGIIEKYCYNNQQDSCTKYGGLYQWNEMMQYITQQGARGICAQGWHIPADEEWKVLEGAVDSQFGIGDPEWDSNYTYRGFDAGTRLKTTSGWENNGNGTDFFGFSALPGGMGGAGWFDAIGYVVNWWSSTDGGDTFSWGRGLIFNSPEVDRENYFWKWGHSVRCLRDEVYIAPLTLTFTALNNASYVRLDSIKVMNRTQEFNTTIFWSDTTLVLKSDLPYNVGDELLLIGYSDTLESGILDSPLESENYTFQFATNIPCPGTPTVEYEGQIYNTIQIFSQCWLKENLNVGVMIPANVDQWDNGIIEKYCYNNEPDSCIKYGGFYQWREMMKYAEPPGVQGICPPGWHIPTDNEWKILEGSADSYYPIGDPEWDIRIAWRGYDAGTNLKTISGWYENGNGTDLYGFSGLASGWKEGSGFSDLGYNTSWWTSTGHFAHEAWIRSLHYSFPEIYQVSGNWGYFAFSVRCLKDD
ncbi:MAG: FISUMP domain-containing protein [Bacteroidales bacterium]